MFYRIIYIFFILIVQFQITYGSDWQHVKDEAELLHQDTRELIQEMASQFRNETGAVFLIKTELRSDLSLFEKDSANAFARFIQDVPGEKGMLLYFQMQRNSLKGKVNFSAGYGLKGAFQLEEVRRILREKILHFRHDMSDQQILIEGIGEYFQVIKGFKLPDLEPSSPNEMIKLGGFQTRLSKKSLFWLFIGLFVSLIAITIFYVVSKRRCPECSSRLHVNIRPLYRTDSPYKRIKIIKCFDCNYFRKYLF